MNTIEQHDDIETALRAELAGRADRLAVGEAPYQAVNRAARRDRNRRRAGVASGLVLAAALAGAVPYAVSGLRGDGDTQVGAAAGSTGPSPLLTAPLRGNLAGDSAFVAAAKLRLDASADSATLAPGESPPRTGYKILYANDDGTHRVVIGAAYTGKTTLFAVLVGSHTAAVPVMKAFGPFGSGSAETTFTYLGVFGAAGTSVPFVVLGPTHMTDVEYATGLTLEATGDKLTQARTGVEHTATVNGAAAGEIAISGTAVEVARTAMYTAFRASLDGKYIDADPNERDFTTQPGNMPGNGAYDAIRAAIAQQGNDAGVPMSANSPGGDAVPDNVAAVLVDLANYATVPVDSVSYHVDWIGRETTQWNSALLDVSAPGLPKLQIFVRGLADGVPDSASPGLGRSFVRPAVTLSPGHLPQTASAFGGSPEPDLVGYRVMTTW